MAEKKTGYKVVRRLKSGARVSVLLEPWHPLYRVYMKDGQIFTPPTGMVFTQEKTAAEWMRGQLNRASSPFCIALEPGQALELWEVEYEQELEGRIIHTDTFLNRGWWQQKKKSSKFWMYEIRETKVDALYSLLEKMLARYEWKQGLNYAKNTSNVRLVRKISEMEKK